MKSKDLFSRYSIIILPVVTVKPVLSGQSKNRQNKGLIDKSKVLQNAPTGAFCNILDLH